jgi:CRP-like cAMP-binding protein
MEYLNLKQAFNKISLIDDKDWSLLETQLTKITIKKNEYYLRAGETEQQIGFITKGSFRWYYINNKGDEVNYHFFFDNNFIVEFNSLLTQRPSNMFIQAMEDSELILLPKFNKILDLYEQSHNWAQFGRKIAESVYIETSNRVQNFLFRNAEERYIELIKMHPDIFQRVSLGNISSYLGIQGPSLSRIRKRISKL